MVSLYHQYYDRLYAAKDYRLESESVMRAARDVIGVEPVRVLDVGCGTGCHALHFAQAGCRVVALDLDAGAIEIAQSKCQPLNGQAPSFLHTDVNDLSDTGFDLAVSLFNVINYVPDYETMVRFLGAIRKRLVDHGVFVFDCWNGLAALLDAPRVKETHLHCGGEDIVIHTTPKLDRMSQTVAMSNRVVITTPDGSDREFHYDYTSTLWTPWQLQQMLRSAGFDRVRVCQWMQVDQPAGGEDWKIMFVCQVNSQTDTKG